MERERESRNGTWVCEGGSGWVVCVGKERGIFHVASLQTAFVGSYARVSTSQQDKLNIKCGSGILTQGSVTRQFKITNASFWPYWCTFQGGHELCNRLTLGLACEETSLKYRVFTLRSKKVISLLKSVCLLNQLTKY